MLTCNHIYFRENLLVIVYLILQPRERITIRLYLIDRCGAVQNHDVRFAFTSAKLGQHASCIKRMASQKHIVGERRTINILISQTRLSQYFESCIKSRANTHLS